MLECIEDVETVKRSRVVQVKVKETTVECNLTGSGISRERGLGECL